MKGWNSSKHPIFTANQMPAPVKWNPMSEDWKAWLGENQVYHGTSGFSKEVLETMKKLHDHILTFGGDEVCMTTYDEDAQNSRPWSVLLWQQLHAKGEPCQCHCNSANLWDANRGRCFIATGYALSEDGLWRSHSWVVQPMPRTLRVWETTVKRVAYLA